MQKKETQEKSNQYRQLATTKRFGRSMGTLS